jgi:hypothetical protein
MLPAAALAGVSGSRFRLRPTDKVRAQVKLTGIIAW